MDVANDGSAVVSSGGFAVASAGSDVSVTVSDGGQELVSSGGVASATTVSDGGKQTISVGGTATLTEIRSGGSQVVASGGTATNALILAGGTQTVLSGGNADPTSVAGVMDVSASGTADGAVILFDGTADLSGGAIVTGDFSFAGGDATLVLGGTSLPLNRVSGFAVGDRIVLSDLPAVTLPEDHLAPGNILSLTEGSQGLTLAFDPTQDFGSARFEATSGLGGLPGTVITLGCFAEGTRIATVRGAVPVERLVVGDRVLGPWGEPMPVRWLGHRRVDCARHPRPREVWPVRVRTGAWRSGVPERDVLLSPDHAVLVAPPGSRPVLIPVRLLIDGTSVARRKVARITYWHVELDRHAALLAEGLPCESFLDLGNRAAFENGGPVTHLHPDFAAALWDKHACAPQARGGPALDWARRWIAERRREIELAATTVALRR